MATVTLDDLVKNNASQTVKTNEAQIELENNANNVTATNTIAANIAPSKPKRRHSMQEVSLDTLAKELPGKPATVEEKEAASKTILNNALQDMVDTMENKKKEFDETVLPALEEAREEAELEAELDEIDANEETDDIEDNYDEEEPELDNAEDDDFDDDEEEEKPKKKKKAKSAEYKERELKNDENDIDGLLGEFGDDDPETEDDEEDDVEEETEEELAERLKERLSVLRQEDNIVENFRISKRSITSSMAINSLIRDLEKQAVVKKADWVLLGTERSITMSEGNGPELDTLEKNMRNRNNMNSIIESLKCIYSHIVDPNKPNFIEWTKRTAYEDIESLFYAFYKACYGDINLIAVNCPPEAEGGCGKVSIVDIDVNKMYEIADDETKEKFDRLLQQDTTTDGVVKKSKIYRINDYIAIGYSEPSIYNTLIQFSTLNDKLVEKYSDILNTLAYIDEFYIIGEGEYIPVKAKVYPDNLNKTVTNRIKLYLKLLKTVSSDQYIALTTKLTVNANKEPKIKYIIPECTCPECGHVIKKHDSGSMLELLFTRRQLTVIANS